MAKWLSHSYLERSSIAGRLGAAVEVRTFSPLLQCCLTVDLLSSYSAPLKWIFFNISFDNDDDDDDGGRPKQAVPGSNSVAAESVRQMI